MQFFNLQPDEKVIEEIKPLHGLRNYFVIEGIIATIIIGVFIFLLIFSFFFFEGGWLYLLAVLCFYFLVSIALWIIIANKRFNHQYYWITNKRIVYKRGLIGYKISSIPLERISDVIISRSFLERLCGFGSVFIESLAGQLGREGRLLAVPNPEGVQKLIFQLVKEKRTKEKITF